MLSVLSRENILQRVVRDDNTNDQVRAMFRFDKRLPNLTSIFKKNWRTMTADDQRLLEVFPAPPWYVIQEERT